MAVSNEQLWTLNTKLEFEVLVHLGVLSATVHVIASSDYCVH